MKMFNMRNLCSSELYKVTQARIWIYRRSVVEKIEKGYASFLYLLHTQEMKKIFINSGGLVPGCFETNRGRKAVYSSLVSPLDRHPDP